MSELQIPFEALRDQINSAIDVIVQVDRYADGGRRLSEVAVVASARREAFRLASVMEFMTEPVGIDRKVTRRVEHRALPEPVLRRVMLAGEALPDVFTGVEADGGPSCDGGRMTSATLALMLLLGRPARSGLLGLWQLLAGGSRSAELAARGRAGAGEGAGRSVVRALDVRLRRTAPGQRLGAWLGGAGVKLLPIELIGLVSAASAVGFADLLEPARAVLGADRRRRRLGRRWPAR